MERSPDSPQNEGPAAQGQRLWTQKGAGGDVPWWPGDIFLGVDDDINMGKLIPRERVGIFPISLEIERQEEARVAELLPLPQFMPAHPNELCSFSLKGKGKKTSICKVSPYCGGLQNPWRK